MDRGIRQAGSLLAAGITTRGSTLLGSSRAGRQGMRYWGHTKKLAQLHCPKSAIHRALQSHQHFISRMFPRNIGKGFQQNPRWSGTISRDHTKGARRPPNLWYCHPDTTVLLGQVNYIKVVVCYQKKYGLFVTFF